jgi:leucyl/phenylalanyl-tRNA--protein transferase
VFVTESMFARQADASKIGLITLSAHLQNWGFVLNDAKRDSGHLRNLGFAPMKRGTFNALMAEASRAPGRPGQWAVDKSIDIFHWNPLAVPV